MIRRGRRIFLAGENGIGKHSDAITVLMAFVHDLVPPFPVFL